MRPDLYRRLEQRSRRYGFGKVLFAHENEAMSCHYGADSITGRQRLIVDMPGEYLRVNCPFCTDTRHRLWINYQWGLYDPKIGTLNLWLAICFNETACMDKPGKPEELYRIVYNDVTNRRQVRAGDTVNKGIKVDKAAICHFRPAGNVLYPLHVLPPHHRALAYLRSRGYDPNQLSLEHGVSYCADASAEFPKAFDRIIVPIVMRGELVGWQGRYIGEPPKGVMKYYNMPGMQKIKYLYNFDVASKYPFVVLTEGVTKVWRIGPEAVAQFGSTLAGFQAHLIDATWPTVVVYLDGNAHEQAEQAYCSLRAMPNRVKILLPPGQEPGDFSQEYNRALILNEARKQGVTLRMDGAEI
jgi:hypothetical protein